MVTRGHGWLELYAVPLPFRSWNVSGLRARFFVLWQYCPCPQILFFNTHLSELHPSSYCSENAGELYWFFSLFWNTRSELQKLFAITYWTWVNVHVSVYKHHPRWGSTGRGWGDLASPGAAAGGLLTSGPHTPAQPARELGPAPGWDRGGHDMALVGFFRCHSLAEGYGDGGIGSWAAESCSRRQGGNRESGPSSILLI